MASPSALQQALDEWRTQLGTEAVLTAAATEAYALNTLGMAPALSAVLCPAEEQAIPGLVAIARRHRVPLYPISTGHNWGYGNALPPDPDAVVVDLSRLDEVVSFDAELGVVTVQPGVTQAGLADYLRARDAPFLVPVHGGGPRCSLLGNLLERGYGITPYTDHFGAVTALEAVLPDGSRYRPALTELGAPRADQAHKWGLGPYLDGLFGQGGFGIVTRATIALAPRPERIAFFHFRIDRDDRLETAVAAVGRLARELEGTLGGINVMNGRRVLSMIEPYPTAETAPGTILDRQLIEQRLGRYGAGAWTGVGALYGPAGVVRAAQRHVRTVLRRSGFRPGFWAKGKLALARRGLGVLPSRWSRSSRQRLDKLAQTLQLLEGQPSTVALPLACWRTSRPAADADTDPARGGCGLIWHAPLVPLSPERARAYITLVETTCAEFGIEPLITLTTLSSRCFDSTVPLLFDPAEPGAADRARRCQEALLTRGREQGFLPYRLDVRAMSQMVEGDLPFWNTVRRIKQAVDPDGIMAPGRYAPRDPS